MEIHIANLCKAPVKTGQMKTVLKKVLKNEKSNSEGVNVILCDDKKILELNRRFRQINKATDVLSFPFNDSDLLGEIYISFDMAKRQSENNNHSVDAEIQRLLVHGCLHLLGHTHKNKRERSKMEAMEAKYL
jgi:probable rRNA maturation factor